MSPNQKSAQFEDRLIDFAVRVLNVSEILPVTYAAQHLCKQIVRSGTAPALLYGEARGAESTSDFRHKVSIALKELRETSINMRIICRKGYIPTNKLRDILDENNQLISILVATVRTLKNKKVLKK